MPIQRSNPPAVHAAAEVEEAGERPGLAAVRALARGDDGVNRLLPGALDGAQPVANQRVAHRLEAPHASVDVRQLELQPERARIVNQHAQLVGVAHFHRHVGAEKLRRIMHLYPCGVVCQQ